MLIQDLEFKFLQAVTSHLTQLLQLTPIAVD